MWSPFVVGRMDLFFPFFSPPSLPPEIQFCLLKSKASNAFIKLSVLVLGRTRVIAVKQSPKFSLLFSTEEAKSGAPAGARGRRLGTKETISCAWHALHIHNRTSGSEGARWGEREVRHL